MTEDESKDTYRLGRWVLQEDWPLWLLMAAGLLVVLALYPTLPDRIPIHWNIRGEIDGWSSRSGVFIMPAGIIGLYLLFLVLPLIDPRRENYPKFQSTYRILRWAFVIFMTVMWGITLAAARGASINISFVVPVMVSALFIIFGNLMGRIRYNWFVGLRTPWALSSEDAWRLTHRVAGRAWVIGGLVSLVGSFFGGEVAAWVMSLGMGVATIFAVAYSYFAWKKTSSKKT